MIPKSSVPVNTTQGLFNIPRIPAINQFPSRYALLIGIEYLDTPDELLGCRNDVFRFKNLITSKFGYNSSQMRLLLEKQATRNGICQQLERCVEMSKNGTTEFIIYFSGHGIGFQQPRSDESDNQDEAIIPYDFLDNGVLDDNTIWKYLQKLSTQSHCLCIWDSCNSGTVADLGYILKGNSLTRDSGGRICPATIISISGCRDSQTSSVVKDDTGWNSALTSAVIKTFKNAGLNLSLPEILNTINQYMKQHDLHQRSVVSTSRLINTSKKIGVLLGMLDSKTFVDVEAYRLYQAISSDIDPTIRLLADTSLLDLAPSLNGR
jgi:hypothetical protein